MNITEILKQAEKGNLDYCKDCFWSPKKNPSIGFGASCIEHGFDWKSGKKVNSMYIVQDPGDTTPNETGRLCSVHNANNPKDKSAQHSLKLWNATVSLDYDNPENGGYLKHNYWTNAMMHGAGKMSGTAHLRPSNILNSVANDFCSNVLKLQILALRPRVIIANGKVAVNSLYKIGILQKNWDLVRCDFDKGAYKEKVLSWENIPEFTVFCTYHPAGRVVNQTLSGAYTSQIEQCLTSKITQLESSESIVNFLSEYSDIKNTTSKGMRYLLNHWLDIGVNLRFEFTKLVKN